jgi:uncharacterized membrane protein
MQAMCQWPDFRATMARLLPAGIAFFMVRAHATRDIFVIAGVAPIVVTADFVFTATAVVCNR